ncbi:MAG: FtsX-like permease family protein, partial [Clostridia bacterium]|nr:FtsX-like permease family protein [Clostridia bacterium]
FGMLRSLGFEKRKIYHILILENLFHGLKAILIGVPIGLLIHFGIYLIQKEAVITSFTLPWNMLLLSVGSIIVITAVGIFCALGNLKKVKLIDSLKNDNIT